MTEHARPARVGAAARFRPRRLPVGDGNLLVLLGDGTIERRSGDGELLERLTPDEPAWATLAIRFGVRTSSLTVAPRGRDVPGRRPPV